MTGPAAPGRFERALLVLAGACVRRSGACLVLVALISTAFAAALPRLELRTDGAVLHPVGDDAVALTAQDRRTFRDPEEIILLAVPRAGRQPLTSAAGLRALVRLHDGVARVPGVDAGGVRSAARLVDVAGSGVGSLGTFLRDVPDDDAEIGSLLQRMAARPVMHGLFLARDGGAAAIYVPLAQGSDRREVAAVLGRWIETNDDAEVALRLLGPLLAETILGERILADLARLVPVMILVMAVLLLACLRTVGGLIVSMTNMVVVLAWTVGTMALVRIPVTLVTTILPVLLLAMCVTDEVHVLARLQARIAGGDPSSPPGSMGDAILSVLEELRRPIVLMTVTAAIGFLSFLSVSIEPMRHFGLLSAWGLALALLLTFSLTPALVSRMPRSWFVPFLGGAGRKGEPVRESVLVRHRGAALIVGILLVVAASPGILRLRVQDSWIANFDPDSALVRAERDFNRVFWGSYRCDVVFEASPGFFHEPQGVALLNEAVAVAAEAPGVGGVVSPLDILDTVAEMLGLRGRAVDLPADALRAVVAVGAAYDWPEMTRLVARTGDSARLLVVLNDADYVRAQALVEHLRQRMTPLAEAAGVRQHLSGDLPMSLATVTAIVSGQIRSIAWTLAGIGVLLLVANRRLRMTLVQVVPSIAAGCVVFAVMGLAGMPLGIATSMFAALTVGVGVDLALHLTHAHERALASGLEPAEAIAHAVHVTRQGQWWSTLVLSVGFLVLTASAFAPNRHLGLVLSGSMLASYLTTYVFVPRLLAR